jgi:flagellar basal-body rod protein FlgB
MNDISTPLMQELEKFLDLTSQRHKLVTANMANIDTPGYRTKDINFQGELERAESGGDTGFMPIVRSVSGLLERPDGNNVSMDREGIVLSEVQLQFGMGIQLMQHEFHNLMLAIHEGSSA